MPLPKNRRAKDVERDWVCEELDRIVSPPTKFEITKNLDPDKLRLLKYRALAEARSGDITKLRQLVSHVLGSEFTDYIQPRKRRRGEKEYPPLPDISWVVVSLIKAIWRKHHGKRRYRHRGEGYSDEEIAAYYLSISEEKLTKNPLLRRKKNSRAR